MSHRVHPKSFRIVEAKDWLSRGFYDDNPALYLEEDFKIREFLKKKLKLANIEKIEIERFPTKIDVIIFSSRPGLIIGRGGEEIELLRKKLQKIILNKMALKIEVKTINNPWASAILTAQWVAQRLEKRVPFRKVLKETLSKIMSSKGVEGARVQVAGRLNGAEMARTEWLKQGKLPRQTLRSNIDYGQAQAYCYYGVIGVKVWIFKNE